jgi:hypothetical protein
MYYTIIKEKERKEKRKSKKEKKEKGASLIVCAQRSCRKRAILYRITKKKKERHLLVDAPCTMNGTPKSSNGKENHGKDGQWHQQRVSYIFNAFDPNADKENKTSNLKMSNVFGDPKLLAQVRAWLISNQKGEERLLFMLEAMKKLRYQASAGILEDHGMAALELYQTYLMNGAESEINLEPALRFDVLDRIDQCLSIDEVS